MTTLPLKLHTKNKLQHNTEPLAPDYLNFIRKNHLKFQIEERLHTKIIDKTNNSLAKNPVDVFDDNRQFYETNSQKRIQPNPYGQLTNSTPLDFNHSNHQISYGNSQMSKNYKTIDIVSHSHQKYLNFGESTIVAKAKDSSHIHLSKYSEESHKTQNKNLKQSLLQNEEFIKLLQQKNKQIAQKLRRPQEKTHQQKYRSETPNNDHSHSTQSQVQLNYKAASEFKIAKPHSTKDSNLLQSKKGNMRDLWKQKFMNWNNPNSSHVHDHKGHKRYDRKKPQSELKFPQISHGIASQREELKDGVKFNLQYHNDLEEDKLKMGGYEELLELDDCNLIKNSKPRPQKDTSFDRQLIDQNYSLQLLGSEKQGSQMQKMSRKQFNQLKKQRIDMVAEWESSLIKRDSSVDNHQKNGRSKHQNPQNSPSLLLNNKQNGSVAVIKKRKPAAQKITNFIVLAQPSQNSQLQSSTEVKKKSKNYKELAREKEKEFESYLIENSILKSTKIVNYYEKQQLKKKILFDQMQQNYCGLLNKHSEKQKEERRNRSRNRKSEEQGETYIEGIRNNHTTKLSKEDQNPQTRKHTNSDVKESQTNETQQLSPSSCQQSQQNQISQTSNLIDRISVMKKKGPNINSIKKEYDLSIYEIKIRSYREFLFMMNLTHKVFININLKPASQAKNQPKYTYFIGRGNNRLLIKSLMNRRFWWEETKDQFKANFVWTQLKVNELYGFEKVSDYAQIENKFDKVEETSSETPLIKKKKSQQKGPLKAGSYKAPLPQVSEMKILTKSDIQIYQNIMSNISQNPQNSLNFSNRLKYIPQQSFNTSFTEESLHKQKVHNHLECNYFIGNKKALFYNMQNYYKLMGKNAFDVIPYTLHIKKGVQDPAYNIFLKEYKKIAKEQANNGLKNIWIVKPGELSNRGQGITVIDEVYELNNILKKKQKHNNGSEKSYILQKYIEKPLLYKNRKFDIRHYVLLTRFHGRFRAYFYGEGYIRTSSHDFKLDELDQMIHLTNDAIQKYGDSYGKHQDGNKVSYTEFQRYLDSVYGEGKHNFAEQIYPKMKNIALDSIKATYAQLDPKRLEHNFELLGLDFMIDTKFNVWLIEVNTNPCLQLSSKLLQRIIPQMAENTLRICIDPLFPPPTHFPNSLKHMCPDNPLERLQYELVFDEARDGKQIEELFTKCNLKQLYKDMGEVDEEDATFENQGKQIEFKNQKAVQDNQ